MRWEKLAYLLPQPWDDETKNPESLNDNILRLRAQKRSRKTLSINRAQ